MGSSSPIVMTLEREPVELSMTIGKSLTTNSLINCLQTPQGETHWSSESPQMTMHFHPERWPAIRTCIIADRSAHIQLL